MTPDAAAAQYQKHCPGCFQLKGGAAICPHCGYDEGVQRSPIFLPHGTILGGQYRVGRVLGRPGGFGITYLGWDVNLQQRVAIKEYLPREIAARQPNSLEVNVHTSDDKRGFEFGKEQFLREARIVAKLDHPNIVRVRNFFNANSTAYLVMDYYEGMSLGDYLSSVRSKLEPELAVPLVKPILEGLQYVHERGLVHRDLKPHNIYLAAIGRPIVLDFGAARQAAGDRVQSLSVVLTEGYAPLEQYQRRAVQGPWTDVYGVAATLYRMITGASPPIALDRIGRDPVEDGGWSAIPPALVPAMRMALAVRPSDRYQSATEFRAALDRFVGGGGPGVNTAAELIPAPATFTPPPTNIPVIELPPPTVRPAPAVEPALPPEDSPPTVVPVRPSIVQHVAAPAAAPSASAQRAMPTALSAAMAPSPSPPPVVVPEVAPPTATGPVPPPRMARAVPKLPASLPPAHASGLGILATAPGERGGKLHRPAMPPIPPLAPPPRNKAGLPWLLALAAAVVVGYVLLNPPGRKPKPAPVAVAKPGPASETAIAAPATPAMAVAEPPAASTPPVLPAMIPLPAGDLRLSEAATDAAAVPRSVRIAAFRMGKSEITVAEFRDFVQRTGYDNPRWQNYPCESAGGRLPDWQNPGYAQRDESPVVCVSWADANAYTQWLTRETGQSYRLPTEAEWEYAARAGTGTSFWWGQEFNPGMAACQSCPPKVPTQPSVSLSYPANPFGLFETLGNVREWTCSIAGAYSSGTATQCGQPAEQSRIAVRGGSWQQTMETLMAGHREAYEPYRRNVWTGFRVAQDLRGSTEP